MAKFIDDKIIHYESDIEKIQTTPAQYISYLGAKGALHLSKEIINNAIDEGINPHSPCSDITIYLDEIENTLTCTDNGRGIPFDKMELVCTTLQSGSKFTRTDVGNTGGQNGVGLCAVNSMSAFFSITVYRYGEKAFISFEEGKKKKELTVTKEKDKERHGTVFIFKPSEFYLNGPSPIKSKLLVEWLEKIIHLVPPKLTITLAIRKAGKEAEIIKKYRNERGLYDYISNLMKSPIAEPVHFMNTGSIIEHDKGIDTNRFLGLEVAFTYDKETPPDGMLTDSFCNFINTVDGGIHLDAVKSAVTTFLAKKTRDSLSDAESNKLNIIAKDATEGLVLTVFLSTDCHPQFTGQTKEKLGNMNLFDPIKQLALDSLENYFIRNSKALNKYIAFVKLNAKARMQMDKAKKSVLKTETGALSDHKISKLLPCNNRGNEYKEIFLVEGDSARGSFEDMRDDNIQAAFSMKGVPLNTWGKSINKMLDNDEIKQMIMALGCNIGDKFNIKKLKYNKIIILTDSDIDGSRICSLLCLLFVVHMPQIIDQGFLYRALPPLYTVRMDGNGKKIYVRSKSEFVDLTESKIRKIMTVEMNKRALSSKDLKQLLLNNRQYKEEVDRLADKLPLHPEIVEFLARYYGDVNFSSRLRKRFPEMSFNKTDGVLEGVYDLSTWQTIVDDVLIGQLKNIRHFIHAVNKDNIEYTLVTDNKKQNVTLYQLLNIISKYEPTIIKRFKGLGELDAAELYETTLDPNKRTLLKFTMEDALIEADKFRILHGPESETKRDLLKGFKINKDDLDN